MDDFKFKLFESIKFDIYFLCKKKESESLFLSKIIKKKLEKKEKNYIFAAEIRLYLTKS